MLYFFIIKIVFIPVDYDLHWIKKSISLKQNKITHKKSYRTKNRPV